MKKWLIIVVSVIALLIIFRYQTLFVYVNGSDICYMQPKTDYIKGDDGETRVYQNNYMVVESKGIINFIFPYSKTTYTPNPDGKLSCEPKETEKSSDVGESIQGDFNGDGTKEVAMVVKVKEAQGGIDEGSDAVYEVQFSNKNLPPIAIACCSANLVYEGDLNNDKKDDFSVYQSPRNGMTYTFTTYSLSNNKWKDIIPSFLIGINNVSDSLNYISLGAKELQDRVFKEGNSFAYYTDIQNITINNKIFEIQTKKYSNGKASLIVMDGEKKVFEDSDEQISGDFSPEFEDFNKDGHYDINLTLSTTNGNCVGSSDPTLYYLFDPVKNTFHKTDVSFGSWVTKPLKVDSNYYIERDYHPCEGTERYHLFKLENYESVYKAFVDIGYDRSEEVDGRHFENGKQVVYVYKDQGGTLVETIPIKDSKYSIKVTYPTDMSEYDFDVEKYFNENYKKFE